MVTPAEQDTMRCRSSMSGPISSSTKGMMCGFTARKRTSLLLTVSLLLVVKLTPNFCKKKIIFISTSLGRHRNPLYASKAGFTHWKQIKVCFQLHKTSDGIKFIFLTVYPPAVPALWGDLCLGNWLWFCGWQSRLKTGRKKSRSSVSDCNQHASTTQPNPQLNHSLYIAYMTRVLSETHLQTWSPSPVRGPTGLLLWNPHSFYLCECRVEEL